MQVIFRVAVARKLSVVRLKNLIEESSFCVTEPSCFVVFLRQSHIAEDDLQLAMLL